MCRAILVTSVLCHLLFSFKCIVASSVSNSFNFQFTFSTNTALFIFLPVALTMSIKFKLSTLEMTI